MSVQAASAERSTREAHAMEIRVIFLACFVPALIRAAALRCLRGPTTNRSIISEAKAAAYTCVSFAFMG
jgi:hypothetical protein